MHQNHLQDLLKPRLLGPHPELDSVGLGRGLRICISNKLPGDADTAGLGTTFSEPLLQALSCPWRGQMDVPQGDVTCPGKQLTSEGCGWVSLQGCVCFMYKQAGTCPGEK